MHQIVYKDGTKINISNERAKNIEHRQKTGMLSIRQRTFMNKVKEIVPVRSIDQHTLAMTKDITCECPKCQ